MTTLKEQFLEKTSALKTELEKLSQKLADNHATSIEKSQTAIAALKARGVLGDSQLADIQKSLPNPSTSLINIQTILDMIVALEGLIVTPQISTVDIKPEQSTSPGISGQIYVDGTEYIWLCVSENFWVKIPQG